ncbi:MAG TPA: alanine dehydrogenase [Microthrixaceae bacterium]|nr:alanine dehydrogenase [Microthrixaceae bacterium]
MNTPNTTSSPVVGVPTEVKDNEYRVALTPDGVRELVLNGVDVVVEQGAGETSAISDEEYASAGARVLDSAEKVWESASLICKVKEPQPSEYQHLREGLGLFTYLHLAAYPEVAKVLLEHRVTALGYETVLAPDGSLPLLAPMSEIAGRMAAQVGAHLLERNHGGSGVLLGGSAGVRPGKVVVLGAGNVGWNAAQVAGGMGAEVLVLDRDVERLRWVDQVKRSSIITIASNRGSLERSIAEADLVIGAVLVAGGRAPMLVSEDMVKSMKNRSVIIDVAIDQGGCIETSVETTHSEPTFVKHGVVHYAVGNMPGAVPSTSTYALTNATLPYLLDLALNHRDMSRSRTATSGGLNTHAGSLMNSAVAEALGGIT